MLWSMTTNCIKFTSADIETAKGVGSISTPAFDLDITVEPVGSANPMAPTHRVFGRSPRGKLVECGDIWKKQNKEAGADYYTLTIRDHGFNANLGKAANQDDLSLQDVIPWGAEGRRLNHRPDRYGGLAAPGFDFLHACKIASAAQVVVRIFAQCSPYCAPEIR